MPCYLVTGDEPLLVQEALDAIRARARDDGFESRELLIATSGFDWGELLNVAANLSLFAEKRIVELRLPTGKPGVKGGAAIAEMSTKAGNDFLFLVSAPKLDRSGASSKWAKALDASGGTCQVWPLAPRELPAWIRSRMIDAGMQPEADAIRMIADRVEGNLLAAQQEIEKLRLLHGEGAISADDVASAVADSARFDVYKLVDAAVAGEAARSVRILAGLRAEGVEPVIVMWALTRELRTLVKLADAIEGGDDLGSALRKAGVWQNRQNLVRSCIARQKAADLYALMRLSRKADAAAKGQYRADPWQLAMQIVLGIATGKLQMAG
ncbi:MAG: DNA polymerase III subunit delta [Woeseiaceae bacterium]|nr:DNA polymerase III subunit delta [Woeseiaceae bacterium]